jgi:hypothetical protein
MRRPFYGYWIGAAAFVSAMSLGLACANGAEVRLSPSGKLLLEGEIEAGDFERVRSALLKGSTGSVVFLASLGGDLVEAIKIGQLIRRLKISTAVPSRELRVGVKDKLIAREGLKDPQNFACLSACFFIFVAGIHRGEDFVGGPNLGIHRPYLTKDDSQRLNDDEALMIGTKTRQYVETYLKQMGVPGKYVDGMFSVRGDQIDWITEDEFAATSTDSLSSSETGSMLNVTSGRILRSKHGTSLRISLRCSSLRQ